MKPGVAGVQTVPTAFEYRASEEITCVELVGSWDGWKERLTMQKQPNTNVWATEIHLSSGCVTFKFVTDGEWVTGAEYDVVEDGFGGENNSRLIVSAEKVTEDLGATGGREMTEEKNEEGPGLESEPGSSEDGKAEEKQQEESSCILC